MKWSSWRNFYWSLLINEYGEKELYDTLVEVKRDKIDKEEEVEDPINKKKSLSGRKTVPRGRLASNIR